MNVYIKFIVAYLLLFIFFTVSITLSATIPSQHIKDQIGKTVRSMNVEGQYPSYGLPWRKIVLDNFTDSLIFNTAYSVDSTKPLQYALTNVRYQGTQDGLNMVSNLSLLYEGSADIQPVTYERYWHGYLSWLRPLLLFMPYSLIRLFLTVILMGGISWLLYLVWNRVGKKVSIALLVGLFFVDYFYLGQSLQYSSTFIIGIYASIYLLHRYKKIRNLLLFFFIVGALTSFFDLLTTPLITLGIPLILVVALGKDSIFSIVAYCLSWSVGYLSLWFSKWLLVAWLYIPNAIQTSFDQIVNRTVTEADPNFSHIKTIQLNINQLIGYDRNNKIIILLLAIVLGFLFIRYFSYSKKKCSQIISWLIIAVIPYAWYLIAANHSYLHVWYTYRTQFISVVALFMIYLTLIDTTKLYSDVKKILLLKSVQHGTTSQKKRVNKG